MSIVLPAPSADLRAKFGEIDIYLFDQLLRGRFDRRARVLDAGCGSGRNLTYLLRRGFTCFAIDRDPSAVDDIRALAADHLADKASTVPGRTRNLFERGRGTRSCSFTATRPPRVRRNRI